MTLYQRLKDDALAARKARLGWRATALTTQIGELETAAKVSGHTPTDAEVVAAIKKTIKNLDEVLRVAPNDATRLEKDLFEFYLPKQLDEKALRDVISVIILTGAKTMGDVMKALKTGYEGQYDGKLASTLIKELLS